MMKGVEKVGESLELAMILSIFAAGINALWGILLLPWGILGIIFALIDVVLTFFIKNVVLHYSRGEYVKVRDILRMLWSLGIVFGLVFLGVYYYMIYRTVDDLVIKSHLIRNVEELPVYGSPKIPVNKK